MTNKEKIRYLEQYRTLNIEIDQIWDDLQRWWDIATRVSPSYSDMPHGEGKDKVQSAAVEVAELTDKLNEKIHEAVMMQNKIKRLLETLKSDKLRQLMLLHYISGKRWEEVAVMMNYEYHYTVRLHGQALSILKEKDIERYLNPMVSL